jgi:TolB-like protein
LNIGIDISVQSKIHHIGGSSMKNTGMVLSFILIFIAVNLVRVSNRPVFCGVADEEKAMEKLGDEVYKKYDDLKSKKIGVFDFTTLNGTETQVGKRLSNKLIEYLVKNGKLIIVERTELNKLMKAQAIEQTGIIDVENAQESGKVLPVDIIINGTVARLDRQMEVAIKVVDLKTGQILLLSSVAMPSIGDYNYKENPDLIRLNKQSPEKLQSMNKAYFALRGMTTNRPLIFLMVVMNDADRKDIAEKNKNLDNKLKKRRSQLEQNKPGVIQTITKLQKGLDLIRQFEPQRYKELMVLKKSVIDRQK